jgi:hypothetical protein
MDFPPAWTVLTIDDYESATPRIRPPGRILDNFRVALGGSKILAYEADLGQLIPIPFFKSWRVKGQCCRRGQQTKAQHAEDLDFTN